MGSLVVDERGAQVVRRMFTLHPQGHSTACWYQRRTPRDRERDWAGRSLAELSRRSCGIACTPESRSGRPEPRTRMWSMVLTKRLSMRRCFATWQRYDASGGPGPDRGGARAQCAPTRSPGARPATTAAVPFFGDTGSRTNKRRMRHAAGSCVYRQSFSSDLLERQARELVVERLRLPPDSIKRIAIAATRAPEGSHAVKVQRLQSALEKLRQLYTCDDIDKAEHRKRRGEIERQLKEVSPNPPVELRKFERGWSTSRRSARCGMTRRWRNVARSSIWCLRRYGSEPEASNTSSFRSPTGRSSAHVVGLVGEAGVSPTNSTTCGARRKSPSGALTGRSDSAGTGWQT